MKVCFALFVLFLASASAAAVKPTLVSSYDMPFLGAGDGVAVQNCNAGQVVASTYVYDAHGNLLANSSWQAAPGFSFDAAGNWQFIPLTYIASWTYPLTYKMCYGGICSSVSVCWSATYPGPCNPYPYQSVVDGSQPTVTPPSCP